MTDKRNIPLTPHDIRDIAIQMEEIEAVIGCSEIPDDDWRWGLSVEIRDDADTIVGHVKTHPDGWFGFYPIEVPE